MKIQTVNNCATLTNNQRTKTNQQSFGKLIVDSRGSEYLKGMDGENIRTVLRQLKRLLGEFADSPEHDMLVHPFQNIKGESGITVIHPYKKDEGGNGCSTTWFHGARASLDNVIYKRAFPCIYNFCERCFI